MILECPSCHARFKVPDGAIPQSGRTVRCSKCAHQWHVDKNAVAAVAAPVSAVPMENDTVFAAAEARVEDANFLSQLEAVISASEAVPLEHAPRTAPQAQAKPVKPKHNKPVKPKRKPIDVKPFRIAVPVLAVVWIVLAFITYFPSWMHAPVLGGIYSTFGVAPTDGLVFSDVTMERERVEGGKTKFIIAGSISNHSNETRAVPTVRVSLRDAKGKDMWGRAYPVNTELKPGEEYPFRIGNVETVFASNVKVIKVDMGNSLQLMVR